MLKRRDVFAGITVTQQQGGAPALQDAGVSKLYPLVCEGEGGGGWKGSSWGFVFVKDRIMLSNGMLLCMVLEETALIASVSVTAIYTKTGGKNGKYSWVPSIANVSRAAALHVQLFRHVFRNRFSWTHNHPVPGMKRFEVIAPWQLLCTVSTPKALPSEVILEGSCDRATFEALARSRLAISVCMREFIPKRKTKVAQEGEEDAEDDGDEV